MSDIPALGSGIASSVPLLQICEKGVRKTLEDLNPHKATGLDQISATFLKELASAIASVLTLVYQASHDQGQTPDSWKCAFITPFFKKGDKSKSSNYSLLNISRLQCPGRCRPQLYHEIPGWWKDPLGLTTWLQETKIL